MASSRTCVCGCGREVSRRLTGLNETATSMAVELLEWDKLRFAAQEAKKRSPEGMGLDLAPIEEFISSGGDRYRDAIAVIHDLRPARAERGYAKRWLKFSRKSRMSMAPLARGEPTLVLQEEDIGYLNRAYPEESYTGDDVDEAKAAANLGFEPLDEAAETEDHAAESEDSWTVEEAGNEPQSEPTLADLERKYGGPRPDEY
jgi:hypothetical protein